MHLASLAAAPSLMLSLKVHYKAKDVGEQGWGEWGSESFQGPVSAPSRCTARSPPFVLSSLYSFPTWFSQIRKPGFRFAGPDCSFFLPSHIKSHRRVLI